MFWTVLAILATLLLTGLAMFNATLIGALMRMVTSVRIIRGFVILVVLFIHAVAIVMVWK